MAFKEQVDKILENRKIQLEKVVEDEKMISELTKNLTEIKNAIAKNSDVGFGEFVAKIDDALGKLGNAKKKVAEIKSRFNRDSVNLGVSGIAKVGKSTLLQTLSGLKDEQIPTGENLCTAVSSRIINQDEKENSKAKLWFYSEEEFIKNRITPYASICKFSIDSISSLESFAFPEKFGQEEQNQAEMNQALERLKEFQNTISDYKDLIGSGSDIISDLSKLSSYVSYSGTKKYYPAVKSVEIYCHFPSLDGVKLQLIDLPGFGEVGNVDEIQLQGLETLVDHAAYIQRPTAIMPTPMANYADVSRHLAVIQPAIKEREKLFSYIVNQSESDSLVNGFIDGLKKIDSNVKENLNLYKANFRNEKSKVNDIFKSVLDRMIESLPSMDKSFVDEFHKSMNESLAELKASLNEMYSMMREQINAIPTSSEDVYNKARDLRSNFETSYTALYKALDNEESKRQLGEELEKINKDVENGLKSAEKPELFYEPTEKLDTWIKYAENEVHTTHHDIASNIWGEELDRLRIKIVDEYSRLDKFYKEKLDKLLKDIAEIFNNYTRNFITDSDDGFSVIKKIREKLGTNISDKNSIVAALDYLLSLKLDFRQNIYPTIFASDVMNRIIPSDKNSCPNDIPKDNTETALEAIRNHLYERASSVNYDIQDTIYRNDLTSAYLKCSLIHFKDTMLRRNEDVTTDFMAFVERFAEYFNSDPASGDRNSILKLIVSKIDDSKILIQHLGE